MYDYDSIMPETRLGRVLLCAGCFAAGCLPGVIVVVMMVWLGG